MGVAETESGLESHSIVKLLRQCCTLNTQAANLNSRGGSCETMDPFASLVILLYITLAMKAGLRPGRGVISQVG